jgi:hypothetical protein
MPTVIDGTAYDYIFLCGRVNAEKTVPQEPKIH